MAVALPPINPLGLETANQGPGFQPDERILRKKGRRPKPSSPDLVAPAAWRSCSPTALPRPLSGPLLFPRHYRSHGHRSRQRLPAGVNHFETSRQALHGPGRGESTHWQQRWELLGPSKEEARTVDARASSPHRREGGGQGNHHQRLNYHPPRINQPGLNEKRAPTAGCQGSSCSPQGKALGELR